MHILQIEGSQIYSLLQCFSKVDLTAISLVFVILFFMNWTQYACSCRACRILKASSGAIGISQSYPSHDSEYVFFELFKGMKHFGPIITTQLFEVILCRWHSAFHTTFWSLSSADGTLHFRRWSWKEIPERHRLFKLQHCEAISLCLRQSRSAPMREAASLPISYLVPSIMNYEVV